MSWKPEDVSFIFTIREQLDKNKRRKHFYILITGFNEEWAAVENYLLTKDSLKLCLSSQKEKCVSL